MERATLSGPTRWVLLLLVCLCAGAVVAAVLLVGPRSTSAAANTRTVSAERGVVQSTVTGTGTLEATETNVNFTSSGRLTEVMVKAGDKVVEGQPLAKIDDSDARIALEQAEANLSSAEAKLEQAEAGGSTSSSSGSSPQASSAAAKPTSPNQKKPQSNGNGNGGNNNNSGSTGSTESAATKAANIAVAQADVDSAQASVTSAERTVSETTVTAPTSGTVAEVNGSVGDIVSGGGSNSNSKNSSSSNSGNGGGGSDNGSNGSNNGNSNSSSGFIVLTAKKLDLQVPFSEADIGKIKRHQPATVTITALPGTELAAHVTSIATLPTTNSGVTSYNVTFALDQKSSKLRSGMSASAQVVISRVNNALNLPSGAISRRGGQATVQLVKNGKTQDQPVVTGITGDSTTQIISGLSAGDEVSMSVGGVSSASDAISNALSRGRGGGNGTLGGGGFGGGGGPVVVGPGGGGGGGGFKGGPGG